MTTKAKDNNKTTYLSYLHSFLGILNSLGFLGFFLFIFKKMFRD